MRIKLIFYTFFLPFLMFSQRAKKSVRLHAGENMKEVSNEHFRDYKLILGMLDSSKQVKYLRYELRSIERIETGYSTSMSKVKLQVQPRKSYLKNVGNNLEVLYNAEESTKATVKPHVFPYVTVTLEPRGNIMRKNQHFTIMDLGFDFTAKTIAIALSKEKEQILNHLTYLGKHEKNKMNCHLFVYENTDFNYYDYTVQAKETVSSISAKLTVNDYMLRTKNKLYDNYNYLKEGSLIKVPSFYCKKAIFYIDEKTMLPISVSIYDEVGLFESYDYFNLEVNKPIDDAEFHKNYKDYKF